MENLGLSFFVGLSIIISALQVSGFRFQVAGFRLQVAGGKVLSLLCAFRAFCAPMGSSRKMTINIFHEIYKSPTPM